MRDIKDLSYAQLLALIRRRGEADYRARQVFRWLYQKRASSLREMTDLSRDFQRRLAEEISLTWPRLECRQDSHREPGVSKYLVRFHDGAAVETVVLPYRQWVSVCISSQVGCRLGCRFCASARGGLVRDLTAGEMLDQLLLVTREREREGGEIPSRVVIMGVGEPLDNPSALARFLSILTDPRGWGMGARRITVSTCGLVPGIYQLAHLGVPVNLAISLHAARDSLRNRLMPVNRLYPVEKTLLAADYYAVRTGRRVTLEYTLMAGINDDPDEADRLAQKVRGRRVLVNVIPANRVPGTTVVPSDEPAVEVFVQKLQQAGVNVTRRRVLGNDIAAACGQLRGEATS